MALHVHCLEILTIISQIARSGQSLVTEFFLSLNVLGGTQHAFYWRAAGLRLQMLFSVVSVGCGHARVIAR